MSSVYQVLLQLLRMNQSDAFLLHVFRALRTFINIFSKMLFVYSTNDVRRHILPTSLWSCLTVDCWSNDGMIVQHIMNCGALMYEIIRHADYNSPQVRAQAATLIYVMLRRNFQERGNVARAKLQLTIATERMVNVLMKDTVTSTDVIYLFSAIAASCAGRG
jgi:hypothetical protein